MPVVAPIAGLAASAIGNAIGGGGGGGGSAQWNPYGMSTATAEQGRTAYDQTQSGLAQQQAFANAVGAQNGLGHQTDVYNQLQGVAAGTGPNPAQAALSQATGANTANQAALMAGQRGTGANAGLLARQAAMQGGANQQAAAGQGATMQAQQSLNAMGQAGNMANQQANQQAGAIQNYNQAAQGQQQNILNALAQENAVNVAMQSNINNANAGINQQNNAASIGSAGGLSKGIGSALTAGAGLFGGGGGKSNNVRMAGEPMQGGPMMAAHGGQIPSAHKSFVSRHLNGEPHPMATGGTVPAIVSPGESYLSPDKVKKVAQSKDKGGAIAKEAEKIPGKAKVKGDSLKNDTVPKDLEPGGIVIPRTAMQHAEGAARFVEAILAQHKMKKKK